MIPYPAIKPYIFKIGPLQVRWYGLMYLLGFLSTYLLVKYQIRKKGLDIRKSDVDDLSFYIIIGLLLGARLGYIIFYNLPQYLSHPLEILAVWHGGMSFHGGLIGCILGGYILTRRRGMDFWLMSDLVIVTAPIGIALGRAGNFINAELYGRVTSVPWGMVFPGGGAAPRHPSQLYEIFFEGILLFLILWLLKERVRRRGVLTALFLILYGAARFLVEFFREPDAHLGFILSFMTMGQLLCILMIMAGAVLFYFRRRLQVP